MMKLQIPRDGCVLVGDGHKVLLLRNQGDEVHPNLQVEQELKAPDNPRTRLQGSDRPPRMVTTASQRSAIEQTDWHDVAEVQFAKDAVSALEEVCSHRQVEGIVIVAPPRMLATIRQAMPDAIGKRVIAEIDKDLTKIPVYEIERHLTGG